MDQEDKIKKEVLKELLLTEEDTIKKLKNLIGKTKYFVKLDQKTNKIVISSEYNFSNPEKILLYLLGKYFSKELKMNTQGGMEIQELEKESGIKTTTLSKPLGGLLYTGWIGQDSEKNYFIHHYQIEKLVNLLYEKFIEKLPDSQGILIRYKPTKRIKRNDNQNE